MPGYARQASFDGPPPLQGPGYTSASVPGASQSSVHRRPTVRGPVPGTIRNAGQTGVFPPNAGGNNLGRGLTRGKTLTRPDRAVAPVPLINPEKLGKGTARQETKLVNGVPTLVTTEGSGWDCWTIFVDVSTFWAAGWVLSAFGMHDKVKQRAYKEKCALCTICLVLMGIVAFVTVGLNKVLCSGSQKSLFTRAGSEKGLIGIEGWNFQVSDNSSTPDALQTLANSNAGGDVSDMFNRNTTVPTQCDGWTAAYATANLCRNSTTESDVTCTYKAPTAANLAAYGLTNTTYQVGYAWTQLDNMTNYMVLDGTVLNMAPYMYQYPTAIANDTVDAAIRYVLTEMSSSGGKDGTRIFYNNKTLQTAVPCIVARYRAGHIDKVTPGCFASDLFLYISLAMILAIVLARFFMAILFFWVLADRMIQPPKNMKRKVVSPAVMPEGANIEVGNTTGAAPWTNAAVKRQATQRATLRKGGKKGGRHGDSLAPTAGLSEKRAVGDELAIADGPKPLHSDGTITMASIGEELFCVCLITCYSEGLDSIQTTVDSIAGTEYSDARKLLFIVCDGMVTGGGEKMSTPDVCVGMIEADPRFGDPQPMSYVAIGAGAKAHNQAMVYAGHYTNVKGHRTPTLVVVKCGPPEEASDKKPGNRGKRDSQMILMNFFSRVTYNDRMTPLDYDLFRKTQALMGVTPDFFEVCLMVDADTKVDADSLGKLVRVMQNDSMVMGCCGETRIANKRQSWVTAIQVFEYYISHHQSKAFEACFGGVTCLPGCFSIYRLKARKADDGDWFPVLIQPGIVSQYSQSVVTTLHQKNLLLLGEDRFLTTLLLRTFPNRKMMFCPSAKCRTVVPDTFSMLLSQRRRWINSTIHNLMELVLVRDLCGTFCFSMQFVVMIDLVGTVVLPAAICLTYTLIINYCINPPSSFSDAIPLMLLGAVLGLPGILIMLTSFKIVYVGWLLVYIIALPVWNFILPAYSFTKFDDFSWGETRKVEGEVKGDDGHGDGEGTAQSVPLRRWEDWERSRLRKIKREDKRRREFERQFGTSTAHGDSYEMSDTASFVTNDDDRWGPQIGHYLDDGPAGAPPPVGLYYIDDNESEAHETVEDHELELVLDRGWQEEPRSPGYDYSQPQRTYGSPNPLGYTSPAPRGYHQAPSHHGAPAPLKSYSLSDAPLMTPQDSHSSQQSLLSNGRSTNNADSPRDPFSPSFEAAPVPSPYQNAPGSEQSPGMSTGFERGGFGGQAPHQRTASLGASNGPRGGGNTPSPTRGQAGWGEEMEGYGQGRRLA